MNEKPIRDFGRAPIKMEGGIADPDEFNWECDCDKCKKKYRKWKAAYEAHQRDPEGEE